MEMQRESEVMGENSASSTPPPTSPPPPPIRSSRRADLDNLRTFLTALVIVHHTAIPYGGLGSWAFRSRCFPPLSIALAAFNTIDQTFFMGMFFFLSGWFSRRGVVAGGGQGSKRRFLVSRLRRLVVPTLVFTLVGNPLLSVMVEGFGPDGYAWSSPGIDYVISRSCSIFWERWRGFTGVRGPVWYCALLTVFDFGAVGLANFAPRGGWNVFGDGGWNSCPWIASVAASFVVRLWYPTGEVFRPLNLQLAYLPQYLLAYHMGYVSSAAGNLHQYQLFSAPRRPLTCLFGLLALSTLSLGGIQYVALILSSESDLDAAFRSQAGGFNLPALLYAVWNEACFAVLMPALLSSFSTHFNAPIQLAGWNGKVIGAARYAYAAFLVHPPVSLAVELCVDAVMGCHTREMGPVSALLGPVLMTGFVGVLNVVSSWGVGFILVEHVPLVGTII